MKKLKGKKERTREKQGSQSPAPAKLGRFSSGPRWLLLLVGLAASGGATYFVLTTYLWPPIPDTIVGTWKVMGGEMDGTRMTFDRDGNFSSKVTIDGSEIPVEARVALRGKTLRFVVVNGLTGREETKTQTIQRLTETEMTVEESGATSKLVRVK